MSSPTDRPRCPWPGTDHASLLYHDAEWGVPVYEDRRLFEFFVLETAQAGLSWRLILHRREGYREAFAGFDPAAVARFDERDVARLLLDRRIVRNRRKIEATIVNARAFLKVQEEWGSFRRFIWHFVGGVPRQNRWETPSQVPTWTRESRFISEELRRRGFLFLGPTIVYAHMQATGMVNDHLVSCYRHAEVAALAWSPSDALR